MKTLKKRLFSIAIIAVMVISSLEISTGTNIIAATTDSTNDYNSYEAKDEDDYIKMYNIAAKKQGITEPLDINNSEFHVYNEEKKFMDSYGNSWSGKVVDVKNKNGKSENEKVHFMVDLQLKSMTGKQPGNRLKVPDTYKENGITYTITAIKGDMAIYTPPMSSNKECYLSKYEVNRIYVPETITFIKGLFSDFENKHNISLEFENAANVFVVYAGAFSGFILNVNDVNTMLNNRISQTFFRGVGLFEECTINGTIVLSGKNINIPIVAFKNAKGITGVKCTENVESTFIEESAFYGVKELESVDIQAKSIVIEDEAFENAGIKSDIIISGDVSIGRYAFYNGITKKGNIVFKNGSVHLYNAALTGIKNVNNVIFDKSCMNVEICTGAFEHTSPISLHSLSFDNKGDVVLHDGSLACFNSLDELTFNNNGAVILKCSPFYGVSRLEFFPDEYIKSTEIEEGRRRYKEEKESYDSTPIKKICDYAFNNKLKQITFNCNKVLYEEEDSYTYGSTECSNGKIKGTNNENINNTNDVDVPYSTFYGLPALTDIVCTEKVTEFSIFRTCYKQFVDAEDVREYGKVGDYNLTNFKFFNGELKSKDINIMDIRVDGPFMKPQKNTFYGFSNIETYVTEINNSSRAAYQPIADGIKLSTQLKNPDFKLDYGEDLKPEDLVVAIVYKENAGDTENTYREISPKTVTSGGFELMEDKSGSSYNRQDGGRKLYTVRYGGMTEFISVPVKANRIAHMEVKENREMIEGERISPEDLIITDLKYTNGMECTEEIDKDKLRIIIEGTEDNRLTSGKNTVTVTYEDATYTFDIMPKKYNITSIYSVQLCNDKTYTVNDVITAAAVKVDVMYENGKVVENYNKFVMENITLKEGANEITVFVGDLYKTITVNIEARKVVSIKASYTGNTLLEQGGKLDEDKLVVMAAYSDGTTEMLKKEDYVIMNYTINPGNTTPVYIAYQKDNSIKSCILITGTMTKPPVQTPTMQPVITETVQTPLPSIIPTITPVVTATYTACVSTTPEPTIYVPTPTPVMVTSTPEPTTGTGIQTTPSCTEKPLNTVKPSSTPSPQYDIVVNMGTITLGAKESYQVNLKNITITSYKSSNTKVLTVNKYGKITTKTSGTAYVFCTTKDGLKGKYKIIIKKAPKRILASFKSKTLKKGKKTTLKARFEKGCYSNKVSFKSSNSKIATVSNKGVITAKKKGTCKITITTYNKKKVTVKITVK